MRRLLLTVLLLAAVLAVHATAQSCDGAAATCRPPPLRCSAAVARALQETHFLPGQISTGTSREQPAIVVPMAQMPYIPNLRFRMTLVREGGGGTVQWALEWVQPYAVEVSNTTLAQGHVIIKGVEVDWHGGGCTVDDANAMRGLLLGVMAGVCVQIQDADHADDGLPRPEREDGLEPKLCFQEAGSLDMLQIHSPSLAQRESYEFFLFFHFVVKPFCRGTSAEGCWGGNDSLGPFAAVQHNKIYKLSLFLEFNIHKCEEDASSCTRLSQRDHDLDFHAVFHTAPGDSTAH